ncbi:fimbrial protein [Escherichia coli]|nr:fimbrial protein [Escherichia coli]
MKLNKIIGALVLSSTFFSMGASAAEKNITVTASVDPTIDLMQSDGTALPSAVNIAYLLGEKRFESARINTQVHTNDKTKGIQIKLANDNVVMTNLSDPSKTIPLEVSFAGTKLSTAATSFTADQLNFGAAGVETVSATQELVINAGSTQQNNIVAGNYQGLVSIVLTQAP